MPVVAPHRPGRQRHQYRLGAPTRLEPEERAAVVDQVEFHVAAAPIRLKGALALAVLNIHAAFDDGQIGGKEMLAHASRQREARLEPRFIEVIEENPADAARFPPVPDIKIFVAPLLETGMAIGTKSRERLAANAVEMRRVFGIPVVGGEVHPAAEPPDRIAPCLFGHEQAHVHVHCRHVGIARVQYNGYAGRLKRSSGKLGTRRGGGWRETSPKDVRKIDACTLEYGTFF